VALEVEPDEVELVTDVEVPELKDDELELVPVGAEELLLEILELDVLEPEVVEVGEVEPEEVELKEVVEVEVAVPEDVELVRLDERMYKSTALLPPHISVGVPVHASVHVFDETNEISRELPQ
jgi:hypothetical protein